MMNDGNGTALLEVNNLKKYFPIHKGIFQRTVNYTRAVDGVSFYIKHGETLGLVGESGCGKTTTGRCIMRLYNVTDGQINYHPRKDRSYNLAQMNKNSLRPLRRDIQIIFQDPFSSLNPRMKVHQIVGEPLLVHGMTDTKKRKEKVVKLMESVGLHANQINRYPHEFSGGQRQRIGLARAIALDPKLIVCDEPVSALDVSIQAQIINLFDDLRKRLGLAYLFIAHDLSVIHHISDRIAVMYLGKIVEITGADELYQNPLHPYTEALLSAVPLPDPAVRKKKVLLEGDVPDPANPPDGCNFHPRCKYARDVCRKDEPDLRKIGDGEHYSACHFAGELDLHGDKSN